MQKAEYSIVHIEEYKLESKVRSRVRSRAGTQGSILDEHFFFSFSGKVRDNNEKFSMVADTGHVSIVSNDFPGKTTVYECVL